LAYGKRGGIPPLFCQDSKRKKGMKLMNWKFWKTDNKNGQRLNQRWNLFGYAVKTGSGLGLDFAGGRATNNRKTQF
jgi:hypothetical protein